MAEETPIIFIHYGPSRYLTYSLRAASQSNPQKKIYFLGDESNKQFCPRSAEFVPFSAVGVSESLEEFRSVFHPIEGAKHRFNKFGGTGKWLSFVFERWFLLEKFTSSAGISKFWTFDSDTMIAADLSRREARLSAFEATEQCRGNCLNGLINSPHLVRDYVSHIQSLYKNEHFLRLQRQRLKKQEGLAFTEMDAWKSFRESRRVRCVWLGKPAQGEIFDDALAVISNFAAAPQRISRGLRVKRVFLDRRGGAFAFSAQGGRPVRLVTLNLSWLPDYIFRRILPACLPSGEEPFDSRYCREIKYSEPLLHTLNRVFWRVRRAFDASGSPVL